jgi:carbon monoxide dehydrogenase subunit G
MDKKPYEVKASILIEATPAKVHEVLNDFGRFDDWSPFIAMDKSVTAKISEKSFGPGAVYEYSGKRIGKGRMEIISSGPERIRSTMTFFNKKTEVAQTEYILEPEFEGTRVTWTLSGERDLMGHLVGTLVFDKMMTKNFTDGLKVLKAIVE